MYVLIRYSFLIGVYGCDNVNNDRLLDEILHFVYDPNGASSRQLNDLNDIND